MVPVGVLVSGEGTNLQAIIDRTLARQLDCTVRIVISNRPGAGGLVRARAAGIPTKVIEHGKFTSRQDFDAAVVRSLVDAEVELVVLAGFDRLVSKVLLEAFPLRVMNIHPALLPAFKGLHAQRQALDWGVKIAGSTVHFVDEDTDHGPIIVQGAIPVEADDTEETIRARILAVEHEIYPLAIQLFAEGRLSVQGRRVVVTGPRPRPTRPIIQW
jgi:phosphoribosylglycinamide formyltransferase-1